MNSNIKAKKNDHETGLEVAVIGMAGRFPKAWSIEELWENLKNGRDCISFFTDDELIEESGIDPRVVKNPNYVKAKGIIEDGEYFDAAFFGYSIGEARLMDPQTRVFHEVVWHALEDAGYDPFAYNGRIGIYAGSRPSLEWQAMTFMAPNDGTVDFMSMTLLSSKDHICTRISYALNLRGPSYSFYTACSTSLVAVHLASQALLSGECDMALAGGITIKFPKKQGYLHQEDMVLSPDGHTRSFDAKAGGLVGGNGAGVVLLKVLEDARRDRDHIYAVIKGTGINNDGNRKIGYTAPSIIGQEELMRDVYSAAEVDTKSITFVECHGSATTLGDPVEVEALRRAFHKTNGDCCAIGAIKTNMGHTDCAAGIASFIKVVLALVHRQIPPSLYFDTPNPKIDFENSPFYVITELEEWHNDEYFLRAAVNSLGLGGTNAHVVLQEAPPELEDHVSEITREYKLLPLSAKSPTALAKITENLATYLKENHGNPENPVNPGLMLADAAYTLQMGRGHFAIRQAFVCSDTKEAVNLLSNPDTAPVQPFHASRKDAPLVFMYSGQGSEYINMGLDLYKKEECFRQDIDHCFEYLTSLIGENIKFVLYPQDEQHMKEAEKRIHRLYYTQPVKFIFEYAYSRLLMRWGLKPHALMGYSFGEYIVACLAGVFSMEDGLKVLLKRGEIMEKGFHGGMMTVSLPEAELIPLLPPDSFIGGVNTDELCLVSGDAQAIDALEKELEKRKVDMLRYRPTFPGHCPLVEPMLDELLQELEKITFNKPVIPIVCGLTGTWMTVEDATDPSYFTRQLREPVRFADMLRTLFENPDTIFLEVGPGTTLVNFVRYYKESGKQPDIQYATMVRHHKDPAADDYFLLNRLAQLWSYGIEIDWEAFYGDEKRRRVSLPGYPFERQKYWIDFDPFKEAAQGIGRRRGKSPFVKDWFYVPSWKNSLLSAPVPDAQDLEKSWLVFMDAENQGDALVKELQKDGRPIITVQQGETFEKVGDSQYCLNLREGSQYNDLFKDLKSSRNVPVTIIHLGNLSHKAPGQSLLEWGETVRDTGYHSLLYIARAIGEQGISVDIQVEVVTNGMQSTSGEPLDYPEKAAVLGPVKNIPQEYPNIKCRSVDVQLPEPGSENEKLLVRQLKSEFLIPQTRDQVIAFRGPHRLVQDFEPAPLEEFNDAAPIFRENGVYLIVGGLGGVGRAMAQALAKTRKAKLILTSRYGLPPKDQWEDYLQKADSEDKTAKRIRDVMEMEDQGGEVMVAAVDVSDAAAMEEAVEKAKKRFGPINGVINSAFVADGTVIPRRTKEISETVFAPKINGTIILHNIFEKQEPLDFFVICSSMAGIFGPVGQVAYTAASAFQDAFAYYRRTRTSASTYNVSINWCGWAETEALLDSLKNLSSDVEVNIDQQLQNAMSNQEGLDAFNRIMTTHAPQVLVSTLEISALLEHLNTSETSLRFQEKLAMEAKTSKVLLKRPQLKSDYVEPHNETEETIAHIWQELFGFETVGVQDDFFELGGDSLKAMTVSSKIQKELSVKIPIAVFFSSPTIEELAQHITGKEHEVEETVKQAQAVIPFAGEKPYYPIAPGQKTMFFRQRKNPENTYFNVPAPFGLEGPVDRKTLETVFKMMIKRHEIYRTSFHLEDGQPIQKIHPESDVDFRVNTCESLPSEEDIQNTIRSLIIPFDLEQAPLFRANLIKIDEKRSILLMDTHQLIIDGTSAGVFNSEFITLLMGKELPPLSLQYKDYAQWQHDRLYSGDMKKAEEYWLQQLKDPPLPVKFPTDFPRPAAPTFDSFPVWFGIDEDLLRRLRDLVRETGATMFMVWMAAYMVLLHKYSSQEDIIVGNRIANRPHTDLERMVGKFSSEVPFRGRPQPHQTFREFLEHIKEVALGAFKHQEYPCEQLEERFYQGTEIDSQDTPVYDRSPFYNTIFVYNNMSPPEKGTGDFRVSYFGYKKVKKLYDILLQGTEIGDRISGLIQCSTELFKLETITRLKQGFLDILECIAATPDIPLAQIDIEANAEAVKDPGPGEEEKFVQSVL
ncbi:MAG: SDR family NAD(P)-dependent oxidoreductase [Candidatus Aminicenantes bacterium]|nr:SDR family NAD(P)-dependent oxidoreductase [Candidatus Aminicenantes bacterium]NIM79850.1 SDR family NAD(P)-dependent oxidoreductase [Candidatus Aminicenantes bacterium]NIN19183.1 SDR family NAD(P)-dependent oxidoreductase [Candidatus Aminicenantes bacterium]NIN43091.1 SDR family NAD(P)-dependent oxidoreductase [Candidatus Aminicenantes bacterium]NIN85828.1 SDR family NAD(P)-dependent oxidoreductase [Candidatus Aminicenantes bacterium]